jgi:hypothetical protein
VVDTNIVRASCRTEDRSVLTSHHSRRTSVPWTSVFNDASLLLFIVCTMAEAVSRRPVTGFAPGSVHVRFVVGRVALGQVFLLVPRCSPFSIIPLWFCILI